MYYRAHLGLHPAHPTPPRGGGGGGGGVRACVRACVCVWHRCIQFLPSCFCLCGCLKNNTNKPEGETGCESCVNALTAGDSLLTRRRVDAIDVLMYSLPEIVD